MEFDRKVHWETIYETKDLAQVSWYQPVPQTSLDFLEEFAVAKDAAIIDTGGGDSFLVDNLIRLGYEDITVLDISAKALERAKERLGEDASRVKWIVSDASQFEPQRQYDFWHDRAVFHFLTEEQEINKYLEVLEKGIRTNGVLVIGTFSEQGPLKCSGIPVRQYSDQSLKARLPETFEAVRCFTVDHPTPFDTVQNFLFCSFRKK